MKNFPPYGHDYEMVRLFFVGKLQTASIPEYILFWGEIL